MSDSRRKNKPKEVRITIIKLLFSKPMQVKDLKIALAKEGIKYSRNHIIDLLNNMISSGDLERKVLDNRLYPVYSVMSKSKIFAEFNSISFSAFFEHGLFQLNPKLVNEFQNSKHKKTTLDGLLMFLGFRVLGAYLSSQQYEDKELRAHWLKSALDLEKQGSITHFFDSVIKENSLHLIADELVKNFPDNFYVLNKAFDAANNIKKLTDEKGKGLEIMFKNFVDNYNKEETNKKGNKK